MTKDWRSCIQIAKVMKTPLLILALLTLAYTASARLGETPAQISTRYGTMEGTPDVIGTNLWKGTYHHESYHIDVTFWNGKAVEEDFNDYIPEDDAMRIFSSVAGEGKITSTPLGVDDPDHTWIYYGNDANGVTGTLYDEGIKSGSLTVVSKDYRDFRSKEWGKESKKKFAGF